MKESKTLEYKETITNTFLKTVSAYANYGTGKIIFGIADDGTVKGIANPEQTCLDIENRINDNIDPVPEFTLETDSKTSVITLTVFEGLYKPYLYKAKAYRRNDSSSIPADRLELTRLILEGQNLTFEELPAKNQNLTFSLLETKLKERLQLEEVTRDTLKTLELFTDGSGFNKAAELLADKNTLPGIDMVRFGDNINFILDHETIDHRSILEQYDLALGLFRKYYQYEHINGSLRESIYRIPEEAFRESIANALVHRTWDINAHINVAMFDDRVEITSPGGLPDGMSEEEYYRGGISVLRNRIIGSIFYRLRMIERFGTGIRRINESYKNSSLKPVYTLSENTIRIVLPVMEHENLLSPDEKAVYKLLAGRSESRSSIVEKTGFGKTKVIGILKKLESEGYVRSSGNGRGTRYSAA
jgi:ATP-dependent DNA helicase RecG